MRATELTSSHTIDIDEDWRDVARAAALGTAVAAGGAAVYDRVHNPPESRPAAIMSPADQPFAIPRVTGSPLESYLARAAHAAGVRGTELAQFLAQAAHETGDFQFLRELGASRYFDRYEPRMVKMKKTGEVVNANPRAARLGNVEPGDGARYRGRGFLHITGRENYRRAGAALGLPLEDQPELLEDPDIAARAALWFWQKRVAPRVQDFADTSATTRLINPALQGLADREKKFVEYVKHLRGQTNEATRAVIYTHPDTLGASLNDPSEHDEPVVMLPVSRIQVLEPDSKFADPKYSKNLKRIQKALQSGQQLPPISVRKLGQGYQVIDGHHRFKAYRLAGATKVPARIVKPENIRVVDQPWSKDLPPVAESQRHDREWVDAVDRHVRLRAMAKRERDEAKFNYHNDAIKKLYGNDNPPVTPAGTFNDDPGGIEIDETLADGRNELYHGTLVKNVQSILANGLNPTVGEFTKSIYKNKAKPLVFAADLKGSRAVYCALSSQIGMLLGHFPVSAQDIAQHGAILVISKDVNKFKQYTSNRRQGSKEPTDYTSQETISIDRVIKGKDLLQWIKTHNADWGEMECPIEEHTEINENFADGKVKGKSRPGRVKRALQSLEDRDEKFAQYSQKIGTHTKESTEHISETRDRMFDYIKQVLPKWPDYVLRDWIYQMARGEFKQGGWIAFGPQSSEQRYPSFSRESILALIKLEGLSPDTVWKFFPRFEFTMSGLNPSTREKILARRGGTENPYGIQRDAERHATQAALAKQQGGIRQEPVIGKMTTDGFELIEGWHRTVQHFKMYPEGYYAPAWVAMNPRPVKENFADGKVKGKSRPGRVKRAGASCAGSVTDLRARAAKYGGERGKMYHWCANMKSGRKKK